MQTKPNPENPNLLEVEGVKKTYRDERGLFRTSGETLTALNNVCLAIGQGEIFGLVGASGSGKTTLGRLVLHLESMDAGSIRFHGTKIQRLKGAALKAFRRRVQMIPQDPYQSLNPYMSVYDTVAEPLVIHRSAAKEKRSHLVEDALRAAGLTPAKAYFNRYPHQLSGGQRQRAAIARAMVLSPEFVIADEPTSMLDASISFTIFKLLAEIRKQRGVTFLFITHDLAAARFLCDRIAVIYHGEIVESGPAESIICHPQSVYTRALIDAQPRFSFMKKQEAP
ncbi:MAG: ABC transporter ATP-binding protein [Desulfobacterales bacterium]